MKSGKLRHRVTLQQLVEARDGFGEPADSWADLGTRWARVVPLSGKESVSDAHELAFINARIELRADALTKALTARDRAVYKGVIYDIEAVIDVSGMGREIHLMCHRDG